MICHVAGGNWRAFILDKDHPRWLFCISGWSFQRVSTPCAPPSSGVSKSPIGAAEINLLPSINKGSFKFHESFGFQEFGTVKYSEDYEVSLQKLLINS